MTREVYDGRPVVEGPSGELLTLSEVYEMMFGNAVGHWLYEADEKSASTEEEEYGLNPY